MIGKQSHEIVLPPSDGIMIDGFISFSNLHLKFECVTSFVFAEVKSLFGT